MTCTAFDAMNPGTPIGEPEASRALQVINPGGLHLRAATKIVKLALACGADITFEYRGVKASARSVLSIVLLAAGSGATVHATATGPGATQALDALAALFAMAFSEGTESTALTGYLPSRTDFACARVA